jgi:predicted small integral membrane protein
MLLCWWGGFAMIRVLHAQALTFHLAKRVAIGALTLGLLMWLVAFLSVGAEWFLMWQSKTWDGRESAFRMFAVVALALLLVSQPDSDLQP